MKGASEIVRNAAYSHLQTQKRIEVLLAEILMLRPELEVGFLHQHAAADQRSQRYSLEDTLRFWKRLASAGKKLPFEGS